MTTFMFHGFGVQGYMPIYWFLNGVEPFCLHDASIDLLMMFHDLGWIFHDVWMFFPLVCCFSKAIVEAILC